MVGGPPLPSTARSSVCPPVPVTGPDRRRAFTCQITPGRDKRLPACSGVPGQWAEGAPFRFAVRAYRADGLSVLLRVPRLNPRYLNVTVAAAGRRGACPEPAPAARRRRRRSGCTAVESVSNDSGIGLSETPVKRSCALTAGSPSRRNSRETRPKLGHGKQEVF